MPKTTAKQIRAIEAQVRYLSEAYARLSGLKMRVRAAKHFIFRRDPARARLELEHLRSETERLHLHFGSWNMYVIQKCPAPKTKLKSPTQ